MFPSTLDEGLQLPVHLGEGPSCNFLFCGLRRPCCHLLLTLTCGFLLSCRLFAPHWTRLPRLRPHEAAPAQGCCLRQAFPEGRGGNTGSLQHRAGPRFKINASYHVSRNVLATPHQQRFLACAVFPSVPKETVSPASLAPSPAASQRPPNSGPLLPPCRTGRPPASSLQSRSRLIFIHIWYYMKLYLFFNLGSSS